VSAAAGVVFWEPIHGRALRWWSGLPLWPHPSRFAPNSGLRLRMDGSSAWCTADARSICQSFCADRLPFAGQSVRVVVFRQVVAAIC